MTPPLPLPSVAAELAALRQRVTQLERDFAQAGLRVPGSSAGVVEQTFVINGLLEAGDRTGVYAFPVDGQVYEAAISLLAAPAVSALRVIIERNGDPAAILEVPVGEETWFDSTLRLHATANADRWAVVVADADATTVDLTVSLRVR